MKISRALRTFVAYLAFLVPVLSISIAEVGFAAEPIVIATASPGGPYLTYGQGLARILSRELGQEVTAQATQGPAQNIVLLEKREVSLAFITMGVGLQAWDGADWTKGEKYRSMRVLFPMYDTPFQIVAAKHLKVHWLDDLSGLRIGAGPRAGTGGIYLPLILNALDIKATIRFGAQDSMATQIQSGDLDGAIFAAGYPVPALEKLISTNPVDFIQLTPDQIEKIRKAFPEMSLSKVPSKSYFSLEQDYDTVGLYNFAVVHKEMSDDLAYKIVKATFANREELIKAQPSARETLAANIGRNTILPLHPGAARYYREIGVPIPAGL